MSTDTPEDGGTDSENDPWGVEVLRDLVPSSLGSEGSRAAVCAIRNPDANAVQIAEKCGLASSYTVGNALRSLLVGTTDQQPGAGGAEMMELRGSAREAETYAELTEKQRAVIDFAAEHPEFVEDRTYGDVSQAIHEKEGVAVGETYVGRVLRDYPEILHRQRALAAEGGEADADLEAVTTDLTVREMLEAAGYDLPDENLDSMPEVEVDIEGDGRQATLGEAQQAEAEFQQASDVEQQGDSGQAGEDVGSATWLSDEWLEQQDVPGAGQANRLPDTAEDEDVKQNTPYWAYVNGTRGYGVFVSLTNPATPQDDVSGLVHDERLYGSPSEYERGQPLVVELEARNPQGLGFTDWRISHPDEAEQQGDSEGEQAEAQAAEAEDEQQEQQDVPDERTLEAAPDSEMLAALDERVANQQQQMEVLASRIDTLREDAVFASEVGEFATEVEDRLDDLREAVDTVETAQSGTVADALEVAENEAEARERLEQRVDSLQEMVNGLGEQVQRATDASGSLGRAQRALQRLEGDGAEVQAYEYSEQDGTVTLHVEAALPEAEDEDTENE